jgi:hypothetical protein
MTTRREFLLRTTAAGVVAAASLRIAHAAKANAIKDGSKVAHAGVVETLLGPIDASRLGFTLPHEHIADGPYYLNKWPKAWGGRAEFVAKAVEKLELVRKPRPDVRPTSPSPFSRHLNLSVSIIIGPIARSRD